MVGGVESLGKTFGSPADGLGRRRSEVKALTGNAGSGSSLRSQ